LLKPNHRAWVEIDESAIAFNVRQILSNLSANCQLLAVVKADAYGHGSITVSRVAVSAGASWLGVATIPEGIELRRAGITVPILVLGAFTSPDEVRSLVEYHLQPTLTSAQQVLMCSSVLSDQDRLTVHLKVDTGMGRLGVNYQQAVQFYEWLSGFPQLVVGSIYSHFATADDPDTTILYQQVDRFQQVLGSLSHRGYTLPPVHLCNTAGMLVDRRLHYHLVRVGLGIYGYYPAPHFQCQIALRPALAVKARITHIKTIPPHTGLSYGHSFVSDRSMRVATVAIGYADGLSRGLSNKIFMELHGHQVCQVGNITMDQCLVDVSVVPQALVGDVVTVLGQRYSAQTWADHLDTIVWEILCGFKHRLPRLTTNQLAQPALNSFA
jgi:alanine racemase